MSTTNKSSKKLSRKEAWLYLAKLWDKTYRNEDDHVTLGTCSRYDGLCGCIDYMCREQITVRTARSMYSAVMFLKPDPPESAYKFPCTVDGAKMRAAFCRRQARKITKSRQTKTTL